MLHIDEIDEINLGIDVDGTLTREIIGKEVLRLSQKEVEKAMLNCTPKDGIDVLFQNNFKIYIITGRQEKFREATTDWLNMYGIPYREINMFPDDFYVLNGYSVPKYVGLKVYMHIKKNIHAALDDNIEVINALSMFGINSYKVDDNFRCAFEKILELKNTNKNTNRSD